MERYSDWTTYMRIWYVSNFVFLASNLSMQNQLSWTDASKYQLCRLYPARYWPRHYANLWKIGISKHGYKVQCILWREANVYAVQCILPVHTGLLMGKQVLDVQCILAVQRVSSWVCAAVSRGAVHTVTHPESQTQAPSHSWQSATYAARAVLIKANLRQKN